MQNTEISVDVRPLTDGELNEISGGIITWLTAGITAAIVASWDLAPGVTINNAAAALGMEYLLK